MPSARDIHMQILILQPLINQPISSAQLHFRLPLGQLICQLNYLNPSPNPLPANVCVQPH